MNQKRRDEQTIEIPASVAPLLKYTHDTVDTRDGERSQRLGNPRTHYYTYHIVLTHGCIEFFFVTLESKREGVRGRCQKSPGYSLCQRSYSIFRKERGEPFREVEQPRSKVSS